MILNVYICEMKTFEEFVDKISPPRIEKDHVELDIIPGDRLFDKIDDAVKLISRGVREVSMTFNNKRLVITRDNYISFINNVLPNHFAQK